MGAGHRISVCTVGSVALALSAPALAGAVAPISGKLDRPGYTVIALAASGEARTVVARNGSFRLVPPAASVTLQLRASNGTYAGPVVVREKVVTVSQAKRMVTVAKRLVGRARHDLARARGGQARTRAVRRLRQARARLTTAQGILRNARRQEALRARWAIVGVRAGAPLGKIRIDPARGYARTGALSKRVWRGWVAATYKAQATRGVPIGAGKVGLVRSTALIGAPWGDLDADGVPNRLDVDDDGDLILDNFDASTSARAAQSAGLGQYPIASVLALPLEDTANSNAANTDIDAVLAAHGVLMISIAPGDPGISAELDCGGAANPSPPPAWVGGLSYCTLGGTGGWAFSSPQGGPPQPFPGCCDSDGDGFGSLTPFFGGGGPRFFLAHGATTEEIRAGDVLIERVTQGGAERAFPMAVPGLMATAPALVSYHDSAGNSATVSYPVRRPTPGNPPPMGEGFVPGDPGTVGNGFPVAPGADGNIVLTLTLWRPQRRPISPETAPWIDIGGLTYSVNPWTSTSRGGVLNVQTSCPPDAYATDDPALTPGLKDTAADQPANPANTISYSVNVSRCLQASGARPWEAGEELQIHFNTRNEAAEAADLIVAFRRP